MVRRFGFLLLAIGGALLLVGAVLFVPAGATPSRLSNSLDPDLQAALNGTPAGSQQPILIYLVAQTNLEALPPETLARRTALVDRLQQTATASQADLLNLLTDLNTAGHVGHYRPLWIINAVAATADETAIAALATRPEISHIAFDRYQQYIEPYESYPAGNPTALTWGLERINAPQIWDGLGLTGQEVTVAIMDTGVDWQHPALYPNYRGNLGGGNANHAGNWFDATNWANLTPRDDYGHGTHVAGTAVGQGGIGVAPGANWIAVRVFDQYGGTTLSVLHQGFQWLLAPAGDPALAPDLVNNSWGGHITLVEFLPDVALLQAAGIVPVFSAGNSGPDPGTINAPAGYPNTLSVGASDELEKVTWFSSRGPSFLTPQAKPMLVAPGAAVLSAYPGGDYAYLSGTSMAAPHLSGVIALLLSANPSLTESQLTHVLTSTVQPMGAFQPNWDSGWGRLDGYAAVASQASNVGWLDSTILGDGWPLAGVAVTLTTPAGTNLPFAANENGHLWLALQPGLYSLTVAPFGYAPQTIPNLAIDLGQTTGQAVNLAPLPTGVVSGRVVEAGRLTPIVAAVVQAVGTPVTTTTDSQGAYSLLLPAGQWSLAVNDTGHEIGRAVVDVPTGASLEQNFQLPLAPTILLVDSGQWYYASHRAYFEQGLNDLNYAYDQLIVDERLDPDVQTTDFTAYDVVVWSAPYDAPGVVQAGTIISRYLGLGGNFFISGQNVGYYDGPGLTAEPWFEYLLDGKVTGKLAPPFGTVSGDPAGIFPNFNLTLNGGDSANNQDWADQVTGQNGSTTHIALRYGNGQGAALEAGRCQDFRIVYLAFGLEGVSQQADRAAILQNSFDYFAAPPATAGLEMAPQTVDDFALPGRVITYPLTLRNTNEVATQTIQLTTEGNLWPTSFVTPTLTLGPCEKGQSVVRLEVPAGVPPSTQHTFTVTAHSSDGSTALFNLHHQTPGQILLVDDDRFYDREGVYMAGLEQMGLTYDLWETGWATGRGRGSPPAELLQAYDMVIWYTGYDWFAPVTPTERDSLTAYLANGGRLFLSSQDFMYYHANQPLANHYLGAVGYEESVTPTLAFGGDASLLGDPAGPFPLSYAPYQNFSDNLIPAGHSQIFMWHNRGIGGLATAGADWRTVFLGFPLETLPAGTQQQTLGQAVGWLSDLGDSTFEVNWATAPAGLTRTYTITLRNLPTAPQNQVSLTNTLPAGLELLPATLSGGASYDPQSGQIYWQGQLPAGASHQIHYQALVIGNPSAGSQLDNQLQISYDRHHLTFEKIAATRIDTPNLSQASLTFRPAPAPIGQIVTLTARLPNDGPAGPTVSATIRLPEALLPITRSLWSNDGQVWLVPGRVLWQGAIDSGRVVTIHLSLQSPLYTLTPFFQLATLAVDDGLSPVWLRPGLLSLTPYRHYLPLTLQPGPSP